MRKRIKEQCHKARVRRTGRIAGIISAVTILGVVIAAATVPAALAAPRASTPATMVRGEMTTACKVTNPQLVSPAILADPASVKALCARSGIRGSGFAAPVGAMIPKNTVVGNCGFSEFWILGTSTHGEARFFEVAYPYPSPISYGYADVQYHNLSKGGTLSWADSVWANTNGWDWTHNDYKYTKTGIVFGYMDGNVLLDNGLICAINYPSDTHTIT
jgi:hypothetical protein